MAAAATPLSLPAAGQVVSLQAHTHSLCAQQQCVLPSPGVLGVWLSDSTTRPITLSGQVMGLMQGKVQGDTFVVIDSFALPVEGTETRVNAQVRLTGSAILQDRLARQHAQAQPRVHVQLCSAN